jgi:hypothetical protein
MVTVARTANSGTRKPIRALSPTAGPVRVRVGKVPVARRELAQLLGEFGQTYKGMLDFAMPFASEVQIPAHCGQ